MAADRSRARSGLSKMSSHEFTRRSRSPLSSVSSNCSSETFEQYCSLAASIYADAWRRPTEGDDAALVSSSWSSGVLLDSNWSALTTLAGSTRNVLSASPSMSESSSGCPGRSRQPEESILVRRGMHFCFNYY